MRRMESVASRREVGGDSTAKTLLDRVMTGAAGNAMVAVAMRSGRGAALFAAVASRSRVWVAQFVSLQQAGCDLNDTALDAWPRQHGLAAHNPELDASGRNPLSRIIAANTTAPRIISGKQHTRFAIPGCVR